MGPHSPNPRSPSRSALPQYLEHLATRSARSPDAPPVAITLLDGEPADQLCQHAAANAVDIIAMATRGRGLLGRVMLGSIADKVLRTADAPVLLCRIPPDVA